MNCERVLVLSSGVCVARFSDGACMWLTKDASNACFTRSHAHHTFIPRFAITSQHNIKQRLQHLLRIRNAFIFPPLLLWQNAQSSNQQFVVASSRDEFRWIRWPQFILGISQSDDFKVDPKDGSITIFSSCKWFRVRVFWHAKVFQVQYPALIQSEADLHVLPNADVQRQYRFVHMAQVFSVRDAPSAWRYPLSQAISVLNSEVDVDISQAKTQTQPSIPGRTIDAHEYLFPKKRPSHQDISSLARKYVHLESLKDSLPHRDSVSCEWTESSFIRIVGDGAGFEVFFSFDESVLVSSPNLLFVEHYLPDRSVRTYHVKDLPSDDIVTAVHQSPPYTISTTVRRALALLKHYQKCTSDSEAVRQVQNNRSKQPMAVSSKEIEQSVVPSVGEFTAFADGRIRVRFYDRALLHLDTRTQLCRLVLPDASIHEIPLKSPVRDDSFDGYIGFALEFADWAFLSAEERAQRERDQRRRSEIAKQEIIRSKLFLAQLGPSNENEVENQPCKTDPKMQFQHTSLKTLQKPSADSEKDSQISLQEMVLSSLRSCDEILRK